MDKTKIKKVIEIVCVGREKLLTVDECHQVLTVIEELNKYKKMWKEMYNLMKDERLTKIVDSMNDIKAVANDE